MQWLMRFRALWGAHTSYQGFRPTPQHPCRQSSSAPGAPRWNDHDTPKEFNFASDVVDYWTQMEKHIGHVWPINYSLNGSDCTWHAGQQHDQHKEGKRGPSPALWWVNNEGDEVKWSFTEVTDLTRRAANVLTQSCGLQEGDRLALILPRVPEWWLVVLGCIRSGIIFIPGTTQLKASDILYRLNTSKAKSIVTTDALAPEVDSVASQCPALKIKLLVSDHSREGWLDFRSLVNSAAPDHTCVKSKTMDPMTIFFTSGTTGFPKMAKHSHGLALRSSFPSWKLMQLKTRDVLWCLSDPGWLVAVVGSLFEPWTAGCTVFSHHLPRFDPKIVTQTFFKYPITQCVAVPLIFQMILQQNPTRKLQTKEQDTSKETGPLSITPASVCARGGDRAESLRFPTLEHCCTVGDFLLPEDQEKWRQQTGLVLHPAYGQSETGIACGNSPGMKVKPGSVGKTIPPFDIQIIDSEGNILPPNTEGNIGIRIKPTRPIGLFMGFENDPEKTAKVECGDFHDTGDIATMDEEGYIWFLGRECDFIKASGYRIGPAEVENALAEHPAVAESAVVSSPDPIRGQVVKAFIVLTPQFLSRDRDQLAKELQQHVKSVTAPYKYPRKVEFVPELPKTITGKIKRSELQKKEFGQT